MDDRHEIERIVAAARRLIATRPHSPPPSPPMAQAIPDDTLRATIRDVLREEVRTRMGRRINENIRRIVRQELAVSVWQADLGEDRSDHDRPVVHDENAPCRGHGA